MFDPKVRQSINEDLGIIGKSQESLQKQLDNFHDWDFSKKDKVNEWITSIKDIIETIIASLQNIADALMDVTTGYDLLVQEVRSFAADITHKDGLYNHFIHEYPNAKDKEDVESAILDSIGTGRSYIKSIIAHYEKTHRLGNW
jgi:nucleoside-diphosphate-sugar epimerase